MSTTSKTIAVFGGNGFLGRKICEIGIKRGYEVTSYSRSGKPPQAILPNQDQNSNQNQPDWVSKVNWSKVDIFQPQEIKSQLGQFNTIVHSIGMLFEDISYKKAANSASSLSNFGDITRFINSIMGSNPMQKDKKNMSYEAVQRDSALSIAEEYIQARKDTIPRSNAEDEPIGNYVYISADKAPPIIPERYIKTKREAEFELSKKLYLRSILMRPGAMYDETHNLGTTKRDVILKSLKIGVDLKNSLLGQNFLSNLVRPVVSTTQVAEALYDKLEDPGFSGVVPVEFIEKEPK
ncbi:uncharacterized protein KGF55_004307 [Candida pseudojiufengensis]|uniref:uncharacterized protein n=1 Tax=Candida pseudojiufengensis TaxID=497109 RepID=UPI0022248EA2|nr:uncharacterized protein KGF55_004307 [Candida pseudojiufengensis]KAI5960737.1 hypothetical protein KGF55_004307 [Candida pseudojiufengensis]